MMIDDVKVAFGAYLIHIKNRDVQIPIPPFEILNWIVNHYSIRSETSQLFEILNIFRHRFTYLTEVSLHTALIKMDQSASSQGRR